MTETDRSVRRLRRPRLTDRWPLRDQSTPLSVMLWKLCLTLEFTELSKGKRKEDSISVGKQSSQD